MTTPKLLILKDIYHRIYRTKTKIFIHPHKLFLYFIHPILFYFLIISYHIIRCTLTVFLKSINVGYIDSTTDI